MVIAKTNMTEMPSGCAFCDFSFSDGLGCYCPIIGKLCDDDGIELIDIRTERHPDCTLADYDDVLNATAAEYKHLKILHDLKKLKEKEEEEG